MRFLSLLIAIFVYSQVFGQASRLDRLSGKKLEGQGDKGLWDKKYGHNAYVYGKAPAKFLAENYDYIPARSTILDMGMGEGRNAVFLASKGHLITGIDLSTVAIKKARRLANEHKVKIKTIVGSLYKYPFTPASFDVVLCFYLVDRGLLKNMDKWLRPGGLLLFEANTVSEWEKRRKTIRTNEPRSYYLEEGELLKLFPKYKILKYEEPLHIDEKRASIILQKPLK